MLQAKGTICSKQEKLLREPQIVQKAGVQIANTEQEEVRLEEISKNQTVPAFF